MKSWKTTLAGLMTLLSALFTLVLIPMTDNDPGTAPNWAAFLPITLTGFTGLFARDSDKSSEDMGIK